MTSASIYCVLYCAERGLKAYSDAEPFVDLMLVVDGDKSKTKSELIRPHLQPLVPVAEADRPSQILPPRAMYISPRIL